ncbi:hypothetical protein COLO4_13350 [Corchorus olitorius]|uniref:Uncharacterized protein n=1 Tax=Corchorus olitorius TaxID=93759 RepID=A0A1R3JXC7_9ROSI|nr:hypothetical protein COLO4_13350 [Corchorus olitorius]
MLLEWTASDYLGGAALVLVPFVAVAQVGAALVLVPFVPVARALLRLNNVGLLPMSFQQNI